MSRSTAIMAIALLPGMFPVVFHGQNPAVFEVATIRPSETKAVFGSQTTSADTLTIRQTSLREIIRRAYSLSEQELDAPDWAREQQFDVVGKAAAPATDAQLWEMAGPLLAERFQMRFHRESREVQGFVMVADKISPNLHASEGGSSQFAMTRGAFTGHNITMSRLGQMLSAPMQRPILDETGIQGGYDFSFELGAYLGGGGPIDLPSAIITALREELGLKLESKRIQVQVMVIDQLKLPDEN